MIRLYFTFVFISVFSCLSSQEWPHPLLLDHDADLIKQTVVLNENYYDDRYIVGFSNLKLHYEKLVDEGLLQVYSNSLQREFNKYIIYLIDPDTGEEIYSSALQPGNKFRIYTASVLHDTLRLVGLDASRGSFSTRAIMEVNVDIKDGSLINQTEPLITELYSGHQVYKTSFGYRMYSNTIAPNETRVYDILPDGSHSEVEFQELEHEAGTLWLPVQVNTGYREYIYNHKYTGGAHLESDYEGARFYVRKLDNDFNLISNTDIFDLLPYHWEVDIVAENDDSFLIYCSDSLGTSDDGFREALVLIDSDLETIEEVYLERDLFSDRSYSIDSDNGIIISTTRKTAYVHHTDIAKSDGNGDLEIVKSLMFNDTRAIDIQRVYLDEERLLLFTYANKALGSSMFIFSLISK